MIDDRADYVNVYVAVVNVNDAVAVVVCLILILNFELSFKQNKKVLDFVYFL